MPVVRFVTDDEIADAAEEHGFTISFRVCLRPNRTAFTVKSRLVKTKTKKGETVEEVVEFKPNDCPEFRDIICKLHGHRDGFVWTNGQSMYRGDGTKIEYVPPPVTRPPLTKAHKKALQEGRKRALAAKREAAAEDSEVIPKATKPKTVSVPSKDNELYAQGFYRVACVLCGQGIKRTGKRGKAPVKHKDGCP